MANFMRTYEASFLHHVLYLIFIPNFFSGAVVEKKSLCKRVSDELESSQVYKR